VSDVDWRSLSALDGTVICYASAHRMAPIIDTLLATGWPKEGRAALIYDGTTPRQETIEDTLDGLAARLSDHHRHVPALLVLGRVVGFREHLRWFDARPLFGRRVLVTRPREQAADLVERLTAFGAEAIVAPMIRIEPPDDPEPLRRAAAGAGAFDYIVFTSTNAVDAFMAAVREGGRDVRALAGPLVCAVGSGTADGLARHGIRVDLVPEEFRAEALLAALLRRGIAPGARVLLPRADIGREVIADGLRQAGAVISDVIAYRTVLDESARDGGDPDVYRMLLDGRLDVVTFTSASAVRNFTRVYGEEPAADLLAHTVVATIGPVTAEAARRLGIAVTVQPATSTIAALADAIAAHFTRAG
jgi:uroporphyrinogen III methyltransferase/synthase